MTNLERYVLSPKRDVDILSVDVHSKAYVERCAAIGSLNLEFANSLLTSNDGKFRFCGKEYQRNYIDVEEIFKEYKKDSSTKDTVLWPSHYLMLGISEKHPLDRNYSWGYNKSINKWGEMAEPLDKKQMKKNEGGMCWSFDIVMDQSVEGSASVRSIPFMYDGPLSPALFIALAKEYDFKVFAPHDTKLQVDRELYETLFQQRKLVVVGRSPGFANYNSRTDKNENNAFRLFLYQWIMMVCGINVILSDCSIPTELLLLANNMIPKYKNLGGNAILACTAIQILATSTTDEVKELIKKDGASVPIVRDESFYSRNQLYYSRTVKNLLFTNPICAPLSKADVILDWCDKLDTPNLVDLWHDDDKYIRDSFDYEGEFPRMIKNMLFTPVESAPEYGARSSGRLDGLTKDKSEVIKKPSDSQADQTSMTGTEENFPGFTRNDNLQKKAENNESTETKNVNKGALITLSVFVSIIASIAVLAVSGLLADIITSTGMEKWPVVGRLFQEIADAGNLRRRKKFTVFMNRRTGEKDGVLYDTLYTYFRRTKKCKINGIIMPVDDYDFLGNTLRLVIDNTKYYTNEFSFDFDGNLTLFANSVMSDNTYRESRIEMLTPTETLLDKISNG